jgi:hypothetical protein
MCHGWVVNLPRTLDQVDFCAFGKIPDGLNRELDLESLSRSDVTGNGGRDVCSTGKTEKENGARVAVDGGPLVVLGPAIVGHEPVHL